MKGDGEDNGAGVRDFFLSQKMDDESASSSSLLLFPNLNSRLSSHGLSMLAGGSNCGFSLKPPAVGNLASLRNLAMGVDRGSKVTGGGFTGFYRASANKSSSSSATTTTRPSLMKLRFGSDETEGREETLGAASSSRGIAGKVHQQQPLKTDLENLTPDECWRLILKLGSRWPAWNGTTTASQAPQGVMKERSTTKDERVQGGNPHGLQLGQDSLRLLATRALEALAQAPDRHGRPAGGMQAPKWTTQEIAKTNAPTPASKSKQQTLATVIQQPALLAKVPISSSREMAAPKATSSESRTAPLTIFYAGTVNVCDNVPEDKARLIMLFAEKAGISSNAQASALTDASTPSSVRTPSEIVRPQEELQLSKPCSSEVVLLTGTSSSHLASSATHVEGSSSDQIPAESSNPAEMAPAEPSLVPVKITITEGKCRQQRQQGTAKPLPNARKNSLARFLDSRKRSRPTASCSEGQPGKKPALGPAGSDGCPSDGEDMKGNGKSPMNLCSQSSIDSKEGILTSYTYDA